MKVLKLVVGELEENCYFVMNSNNEVIIIDPGDDYEKIMDFVKDKKVVGILVTHFHFDHVGALNKLEEYYGLKANGKISSFSYEVIKTPGHTRDSLSFYFPLLNAIFVGDFIFRGTIGRMDLGGNESEMKESLEMFLKRFSDDVCLYPGHGESTMLGLERKNLEYIISRI